MNVHGIISRLVATIAAAAPQDVEVWDGDLERQVTPQRVIAIGLGMPAASVTTVLDEGGPGSVGYDIAVNCAVIEWDGDEEFTNKRDRAQGLLDLVRDALGTDRRLGGLAAEAWIEPTSRWFQTVAEEGYQVEADFTITARLYGR